MNLNLKSLSSASIPPPTAHNVLGRMPLTIWIRISSRVCLIGRHVDMEGLLSFDLSLAKFDFSHISSSPKSNLNVSFLFLLFCVSCMLPCDDQNEQGSTIRTLAISGDIHKQLNLSYQNLFFRILCIVQSCDLIGRKPVNGDGRFVTEVLERSGQWRS